MLVSQQSIMKVTQDTSVPDLIEKCRQMDNGMLIVWVHGGRIAKVAEVDKPAPIERIIAKAEQSAKKT